MKESWMKVWRVNVRTQTFTIEPTPESWQHLGGRGLIARIMVDEVEATSDPLGPKNKLIFAPGLMVGHRLSSLDRISIGGKSPLTGGIKEANAGGRTGYHLTQLGIKALILEDQPKEENWQILVIDKDGIRFEDGGEYVGKGVYETAPPILAKFGEDIALALIGPGGEMQMKAAGIQNIDKDLVPSRIAARGGLGAVLGSKLVKAIVIDAKKGEKPPIEDEAAFKKATKEYTMALRNHPQTTTYADYGTAAMTNMCNTFGGLPTRSFSAGSFEGAEKISGEMLRETLLKRGGVSDTTHACMAGCSIRCSNVFGDENGKQMITSPLEYETIGLMGSNLEIDNLETIAKMNQEVNDLGLDSIEIGAALGVACEAGLMEFGDGERALELIEEIRQATPLGRTLGDGAASMGREYDIERVPVVKNQAISAYDPRAIKGTGVTYATSPQGADHTSGLTIRAKIKHTDPKGQAEVSKTAQLKMAGYDTLGACLFAGFGFAAAPETIAALLNSRYGTDYGSDILQTLGKECIRLEREFNAKAGFTKEDDRLPKWMTKEKLPPMDTAFDVPEEELDHVFDDL
jgi:aldehyde:ferredoxin oxidoreductase